MEYEILLGHRSDGNLLWIQEEKNLYIKKKTHKSGLEDWICYEQILQRNKTETASCTSRVLVDRQTKLCTRKKIEHIQHPNHDVIYKDLQTRNKIIDDSIAMRNLCEDLSVNVPAFDIFTREVAK